MSRCRILKTLFIVQIFFGLLSGIFTDEDIFGGISFEDRRNFFATEDGSVPEYQIVQPLDWHESKRSVNPVIRIPFNASGEMKIVHLNIVEDHDLIGPRTTGVWFANHNPNAYHNVSYIPRPDIFTRIGNFRLYQNISSSGAITVFTYFDDEETFIGMIEDNYILKSLPNHMSNKWIKLAAKMGSTNSPVNQYDNSSPFLVIFKGSDPTQMYPTLRNDTSLTSHLAINIDKRPQRDFGTVDTPEVVFPKLLVSVDCHSVSQHRSAEDFVRDLIAYLNAVDMMYRKIDDPKIRLTITGIILAQDESATPYVVRSKTGVSINADETLDMTSKYFSEESQRFPLDNYDVVIVMVDDRMWTVNEVTREKFDIDGIASDIGAACYRQFNAAAMTYHNDYGGIETFVHELAHLFGVYHDPMLESINRCENDCIMCDGLTEFRKLCWSSGSQNDFTSFFSSDDSKCMHKRPKKIDDFGKSMQGTWLSLYGQCQNKLTHATGICWNELYCTEYRCSDDEPCRVAMKTMEGSIRPDGKRCINGTWMELD